MLPPDGEAWPPRYTRPVEPEPVPAAVAQGPGRPPADAQIEDWRAMGPGFRPEGYGRPEVLADVEPISLAALVVAAVAVVLVVADSSLAVVAALLAFGFAAAGRRAVSMGGFVRWWGLVAAAAMVVAYAVLAWVFLIAPRL